MKNLSPDTKWRYIGSVNTWKIFISLNILWTWCFIFENWCLFLVLMLDQNRNKAKNGEKHIYFSESVTSCTIVYYNTWLTSWNRKIVVFWNLVEVCSVKSPTMPIHNSTRSSMKEILHFCSCLIIPRAIVQPVSNSRISYISRWITKYSSVYQLELSLISYPFVFIKFCHSFGWIVVTQPEKLAILG